jgi:hypothetical protein
LDSKIGDEEWMKQFLREENAVFYSERKNCTFATNDSEFVLPLFQLGFFVYTFSLIGVNGPGSLVVLWTLVHMISHFGLTSPYLVSLIL